MNTSDITIDFLSGKIDYDTWKERLNEAFNEAVMKELREIINGNNN